MTDSSSSHLRRAAVILGVVLLGYAGCGRSGLDDPFPSTTDVMSAGAAGTGVNAGAAGTAANTGASGAGSAGRTGAAGTGRAGTTGAVVGAAGVGAAGVGAAGVGAAGVGAAGATGPGTGGVGAAGTGANTGAAGASGPGLSCGAQTCALGQSCCVQSIGGMRVDTCLDPGQPCVGGGNIGCVAGTCGNGLVCCLSLVAMASACATPTQCMDGISTVLCSTNRDCPADRQYCCPAIGVNICRPYRCPRAGGGN
jgi:hypothetical protein